MKRLLLVGGGHAHLEVIRQFQRNRAIAVGTELVWASPAATTAYSGMLPGVVAGHYRLEDMLIHLQDLATAARCKFIPQPLIALDITGRSAAFADSSQLEYDLLSLNTGSVADLQTVPGAVEHATALRPFDTFLRVWASVVRDAGSGNGRHIVVVGGGAGGVEIALAIAYRLRRAASRAGRSTVTLVTDTPTVLRGYPPTARKTMERMLAEFGVDTRCDSRVSRVTADAVATSAGETIVADCVIWATTGTAPAWPLAAGIATDARGFVAVDGYLRSTSNPEIFGGGDIVTMVGSPHPKSGVYAVRHGPVLAANLHAALDGKQLASYVPQRRALALLSAGDKFAVGTWGPWTIAGKWVWRWKDRIDRAFVARYCASTNHA